MPTPAPPHIGRVRAQSVSSSTPKRMRNGGVCGGTYEEEEERELAQLHVRGMRVEMRYTARRSP
jgi:hypothetical protein